MVDLFAWAGAAPGAAAPAASTPGAEPKPCVTDHTEEAPPRDLPWPPHGAIAWPHRYPTAEELADPAFGAVFNAIRPWTIYEPALRAYGFATAQHAALIVAALRRAGVIPGAADG